MKNFDALDEAVNLTRNSGDSQGALFAIAFALIAIAERLPKPTNIHVQDEPPGEDLNKAVLNAVLPEWSDRQGTVREYLIELLATVWRQEESFSGKRPFGNSGWQWDLYSALAMAGLVDGQLDEYGQYEDINDGEADQLITAAIQAL